MFEVRNDSIFIGFNAANPNPYNINMDDGVFSNDYFSNWRFYFFDENNKRVDIELVKVLSFHRSREKVFYPDYTCIKAGSMLSFSHKTFLADSEKNWRKLFVKIIYNPILCKPRKGYLAFGESEIKEAKVDEN